MESMALTNREKASLYSETCSSVKESAWGVNSSAHLHRTPVDLPRKAGVRFGRSIHDEKEGKCTMMRVVGGEGVKLEVG